MKIFKIYFNPEQRDQSVVILCGDLSIQAAVLNWLWATYQRMWGVAACTLVVQAVAFSILHSLPSIALSLTSSIFLVYLFFGKSLYAMHLERAGYKLRDIVLAHCPEEAELKYYTRRQAA